MIGLAPPEHDPDAPQILTTLPVGSPATVRSYVGDLIRRHRTAFTLLVAVNAVAVIASMAGPYLLGGVVEKLAAGARDLQLERTIGLFAVALAAQTVFVRLVRLRGAMLGEQMLADLREDFLVRSVALPPGVLERAGTGDLLSRITTDIDRLSSAMREAVPQLAIGVVWVALLLGGLTVTAPPLALSVLVALPLLIVGCRWYFKRAPGAYRSEAAGYAAVSAVLTESVDAGRTVEAHRLGARRIALSERRIREWTQWERYTLFLRSVLFPVVDLTHVLLLGSVLLLGGAFVIQGWITPGQLTTGALLAQMMIEPVGMILRWYDELQVAQVSIARLVGVREIEPEATGTERLPDGRDVHADEVTFGYRAGVDVLREVSLRVLRGPGWRSSGRPAPANRHWAGCWPESTVPAWAPSPWAGPSSPRCRRSGSASRWHWSTRNTMSSSARSATIFCWRAGVPPMPNCGPRSARWTPMTGRGPSARGWTPRSARAGTR